MNAATATACIVADLADPTKPFPSAGVHPPAPQSLANGATGVALLHIERANAGHGGWATAHAWLAAATTGEINAGPNASLFHGAPALAHTLHAVEHPQAYRRAREALHAATITLSRARLDRAHARIDRGDSPALAEFDLLRGLTGLGAYHLHADADSPITADLLTYLVRLTEPRADGLPGWWTDHGPTGEPLPGGHGNLGIAHGIAGPLALLALAHRRGVIVDGHIQAIARICAWYDTWVQHHPAGRWWPRTVTRAEHDTDRNHQTNPGRPSWCYGTPGIARAQQLAAIATGDTTRQHTAETALLGCLTDTRQLDQITDLGLCHGLAGLLHTTHRAAADARTPHLRAHLDTLTTNLINRVGTAAPGAELLDGTTGAALALHTLATPASGWDACLLTN